MMDVAINGGTHVYGDKMFVNKNISKPDSTLNKMINAVGYYTVRVSVVQKIQQTL